MVTDLTRYLHLLTMHSKIYRLVLLLSLLKEPQGQLKQILLYHVVEGKLTADDVVRLTSVKTLQGSNVNITVTNGVIKINDATVIKTGIQTSNGAIYSIDKVLLPPK